MNSAANTETARNMILNAKHLTTSRVATSMRVELTDAFSAMCALERAGLVTRDDGSSRGRRQPIGRIMWDLL